MQCWETYISREKDIQPGVAFRRAFEDPTMPQLVEQHDMESNNEFMTPTRSICDISMSNL